jgi:hypothetical protein
MPDISIAERVARLEQEVARLRNQVQLSDEQGLFWLDQIYGAFKDEPAFLDAMKLGRKYRESLRPKPQRRKKSKSAP